MPWFEFVCPHCSRRFGLENPTAGGLIACPECGQSLAIPAELPLPSDPIGAGDEAEASDIGSLDFIRPTLSMESHRTLAKSPAAPPVENQPAVPPVASSEALPKPPVVRQLTRQEKEARRQRRSLVLMVGGLILLIATLIVLSRL
jgi:hypothetical protein